MRTTRRWGLWFVQSAAVAMGALFASRIVAAQAATATPSDAVLTINSVVPYVGLLVTALIGRWSWAIDKATERAQQTADRALQENVDLRLRIAEQHLPKAETAAAMEAALRPINAELQTLRAQMSRLSTQIIRALLERSGSALTEDDDL